jgi:D-serine deaminase-like pyridoxal phosphate-dependent protein
MEANIAAMAEVARSHGVGLRPHVKTHKVPALGRRQLDLGAIGVTVAKMGEAEVFGAEGFDEILVAYSIVGQQKVSRLIALARRVHVISCVDNFEAAEALSIAASREGVALDVLLDVDTGLNRTGCSPQEARALGNRVASMPGLRLIGVFTYAAYPAQDPDEIVRRAWSRHEAETAVDVALGLQADGIGATVVSVAGSACAAFAANVPGVTEVRPGSYVFGDANLVRLGVIERDACALYVRTTVVSRPAPDRAVLDAGTKTLSSDRPNATGGSTFGEIVDHAGSRITRAWEEHAVVELAKADQFLKVGDVVNVLPNHACPVVNLANQLYGVREGAVVEVHQIAARGLVQ